MPSSNTGESDTTDPMPVVSDDMVSSEHEVYTSDTTSTDDDDFQPFALPDVVAEPADGPIAGDLPLAGVQHHSHDTDPDVASSAAPAPAPSFEFGHDIDDDSDPVFPPGFDLDHDIEFIHLDQPMEDPVAPVDPMFADPADFEMEFDDLEPVAAPEPADAPVLAFEHDPVHADVPPDDPLIADIPVDDHLVVVPQLVDDHVAIDAHIDAPHIADIPADPVVAPLPDPVPLQFDNAPFATHVDPRYAHTRNGWIDDDDDNLPFVVPVTPASAPATAPIDAPLFPTLTADAHRTDLPITFLQDIPPPRPGEGSSRQPFGQIPFMTGGDQFVPPISHHTAVPPVAPFAMPSFAPSSEPFLWTSPPIMPPSDPYHP
ncbi:cell surface glycoprotein 1-like [Helianthus annuus]|uniref:cell surface glycoprotein 1-like n=1 Tax=Helianthus annuus TaxID=4232 RepID=UPI000B8F927F|nr:cell surface glycoprotein 1-like [Helianthus annuus]